MSIIGDITRAYREPIRVMKDQIATGISEPQTLFIGMMFVFLNFVAATPQRIVVAEAKGDDVLGSIAALFVANIFIALLFMYLLAFIKIFVIRTIFKKGDGPVLRRAFFWSALVTSPLILLAGALQPFTSGIIHTVLLVIVAIVFIFQWICTTRASIS